MKIIKNKKVIIEESSVRVEFSLPDIITALNYFLNESESSLPDIPENAHIHVNIPGQEEVLLQKLIDEDPPSITVSFESKVVNDYGNALT